MAYISEVNYPKIFGDFANSDLQFSIIIPNFNYAEFVGAAIESALSLDWPNVEVIVVDDGSTDDSRSVIESFGDRVIAIFQENASQRVACNCGFARSTGDAIIFLDSDDLLDASVAREAAAVCGPDVAKIQFQMQRMDAQGRSMNSVFPVYEPMPTPEKIREWAGKALAYPTPPGSGNVYARWFLENLFPLDDSCGNFSDSACLATAALFGDVVTIPKPLVFYRIHPRNDSRVADDGRFAREILRAEAKFKYSRRFHQKGEIMDDEMLFNSIEVLQFRIASLKLSPQEHPVKHDGNMRAMKDAIRLFFASASSRWKLRAAVLGWSFLTLFSPKPLARRLIDLRYR